MKTKKSGIPTLRDDPDYAAADDLCTNLAADIAELQRRLNAKIAARKKTVEVSAPVLRLLGDPVTESDDETPAMIEQKIRDASAAHKIAIQRRETKRIAAGKASFQAVEGTYRENVKDVADALVLLNNAVGNYQQLVDELQRLDVPFHVWARPMSVAFVERSNDVNGPIASFLAEAAAYRLIDPEIIPRGLRR